MSLHRATGYLLVLSSSAGIIFSLLGMVTIWAFRPVITQSSLDNLKLIDQTLNSTESILITVNQMVETTTQDVTSLQTTTKPLSIGIQDANPMFDSLMYLTGRDLPAAIGTTQTSLASAQSSALLIDNALTALTGVPFSQIAPYRPAVPLHIALANVSDSLDSITPSLEKISLSLAKSKADLGVVDGELTKISETTQAINISLGNAKADISNYKLAVSQLVVNVETPESRLTSWSMIASWILTILLIWVIVGEAGLGLHGLEIIYKPKAIINPTNEA